jgi:hypothetical protein
MSKNQQKIVSNGNMNIDFSGFIRKIKEIQQMGSAAKPGSPEIYLLLKTFYRICVDTGYAAEQIAMMLEKNLVKIMLEKQEK